MSDDVPPPLPDYPPAYANGPVVPASPSISTVHFHHASSASTSTMPPSSPAASNDTPHHHSNASSNSIDLDASSNQNHSGWLHKLGGQVKRFKRRFFRLQGSRLAYFKDDQTNSRRLGVIPLVGASLVVFDRSIYGESSCFGLTPAQSKRTFCLKGANEQDMQKWLTWLRPQVQKRLQDKGFFQKNKHYPGSLREGVLEQQRQGAAGGDRWSERFLVLTQQPAKLVYYKEIESTKPAGEIYLDNTCVVASEDGLSDSPFAFSLSCARSSSTLQRFVFRCSDVEEKQDWIQAIQQAIAGATSNTTSPTPPESSVTSSTLSTPGHGYSGSASDIPLSPSSSAPAPAAEIKTIHAKGDAGFQYSASESEELSDLSLDSESEQEDDGAVGGSTENGLSERLASGMNLGRALPPVPETKAQAPKVPPPPPPAQAVGNNTSNANTAAAASSSSAASSSNASGPIIATKQLDLHSTRIVKEGYLKKLGAKVKNWKNRYFKLVGYVLTYHESREVQTPGLGEIHLIGTLVKSEPDSLFGQPWTFSITQTQAGSRTYYLIASDKEEMNEWIFLLKQRHSFSPGGLPLRLNPRVHINMNLNPDDAALRAIAINSAPINSNYISTDADRKENSKSSLKGAVSKKKRRFILDGFDLDLTCLSNNDNI